MYYEGKLHHLCHHVEKLWIKIIHFRPIIPYLDMSHSECTDTSYLSA